MLHPVSTSALAGPFQELFQPSGYLTKRPPSLIFLKGAIYSLVPKEALHFRHMSRTQKENISL